jgi:hypothetical protein
MLNHQGTFIFGVSWARAKSKFPSLSFNHFWWAKLGLYDKKNQEASRFWRNTNLMDRQSERLLFGSRSTSGVLDDVEDEDAIDFIFGRGRLSLDAEGELKVPKLEPLELDERDH